MARTKHADGGDYSAIRFDCPGCGCAHVVPVTGAHAGHWNGNLDRPTLDPSVLVRSGHHAHPGSCWCKFYDEHPEITRSFVCVRCHSYVRDGRIEFMSDCSHALAGQTVDLPEIVE